MRKRRIMPYQPYTKKKRNIRKQKWYNKKKDIDTSIQMDVQNEQNDVQNEQNDVQNTQMETQNTQLIGSDTLRRREIEMEKKINYFNMIEDIEQLIKKYGIYDILDMIEPIRLLFSIDRFYMPNIYYIERIINVFKIIFTKHLYILNDIFDVVETLSQMSVNGKIFIISIKNRINTSLLVKVPLKENSDPISYEYYIGLTLNKLRYIHNIYNFSLVYGRFMCKIDTRQLDIKRICDTSNPYAEYKTHVVYEYIKDNYHNGKVMTLKNFIISYINDKNEMIKAQYDILQVLFMLMVALQQAQDYIKFTHYDLHLENILVVVMEEEYPITVNYRGNMVTILTRVVPHIIDYGRSYVDVAESDNDMGIYIDNEKNKIYSDFGDYQRDVFKHFKDGIIIYNQKYIDAVDELIRTKMEQLKIEKSYGSSIFKRYYGDNYSLGIKPFEFHKRYDFHRLIKTVGNIMLMIIPQIELWSRDFWVNLMFEFERAYPFYVPYYNALPIDYESITGKYNSPIDVADTLFKYINEMPLYMQLGAGEKRKRNTNEKIKKDKGKKYKSQDKLETKLEIKITKKFEIDDLLKKHIGELKTEDIQAKPVLLGPIDEPYEFGGWGL